jgi:hypothetical protein
MDRDTAVSRIQQKLGFRSDRVTEIQNALNDAQLELENSQSLPWFLIQQNQAFSITPASPPTATPLPVALPTGFIKEVDDEDGNISYQQTTPGPQVFLKKMDYKQAEIFFFARRNVWYDQNVEIIQSEDTTFTAGLPIAYVLQKNAIVFYPGPDQPYTFRWSYYTHDQPLNGSNVTSQWLQFAPWLLIGKAGMLFSADTRDADAYAAFQAVVYGDKSKGIRGAEDAFLAQCYERELGGRTYRMGGRL